MKRCPISPVTRQIQIKTTMRYYFTPVRIAIIKSIYKHTGVGCQESGKIEQLNWTETCWRASGQKESSCTIAKSVNWYSLILYWYSILVLIFHIKLYSLIWKTVWRFLKKTKNRTTIWPNSLTTMWNLEKWYKWSYLQSRNRDTDVENKCMDTKGEWAVEQIRILGLTHLHYWYMYKKDK